MNRVAVFSLNPGDISTLRDRLEKDFDLTHVGHVESLVAVLETWRPHVLIYVLDRSNTELIKSTFEICDSCEIGKIVLARAYNLKDETQAFAAGADDYLLVSTSSDSVIMRVRSLIKKIERIRKSTLTSVITLPAPKKAIQIGPFNLDLANFSLSVNGEYRTITPTQFHILELMFANPNQIFSREKMRQMIFNQKNMSLRSIDAHISKLKVVVPELRHWIFNIYGKGYMLKPSEKERAS